MEGKAKFLSAKDVAEIMIISETSAYRLIKKLNEELENKGKINILALNFKASFFSFNQVGFSI